jgi:hypothetical protein
MSAQAFAWAATLTALFFAMLLAEAYSSLHNREKQKKDDERQKQGMRSRIDLLEQQVTFWQSDAAYWREQATQPSMVWPVDVKNTWMRIGRN